MSQDWTLSIDGPNGTVNPVIFGDASYVPRVNGRPEVHIPTEYLLKYQNAGWDNAPMTVTIDGDELPIDRLEERRTQKNSRSEATTKLIGRGGPQLRRDVDLDVDARPTHIIAEEVITDTTDYTANVDEPTTTEEADVVIQQASDTAKYRTLAADPIPPTSPVTTQNGQLSLLQSAFVREAENGVTDADGTITGSQFSDGEAVRLANDGDRVRVSFSNEYTIPFGSVEVAARADLRNPLTDFNGPGLLFELDGHPVARRRPGWGGNDNARWIRYESSGKLAPGEHTVSVTQTSTGTESIGLDMLGVVDNRYDYTFKGTPDANGYLPGPEQYPDEVQVEFEDADIFRAATEAVLEIDVDSVQGNQAVALSSDGGENWDEFPNTNFTRTQFAPPTPSVRPRITLSRHGARSSATPTTGIEPTTVESFEVRATLTDLPLTIDWEFQGPLEDALSQLATQGRGNFVWAYESDGSDRSVEFTQRGQRVASSRPPDSRLELEQDAGDLVERAIVLGGEQSIEGEQVGVTVGEAVGISAARLLPGSEAVYRPQGGKSDSYEAFERGEDYSIDYQQGTLTALSGGRLSDGQVVALDYRYQPRATVTADGVSDPATETFEFPSLSSIRACRATAQRIVDTGQEPRQRGGVRTPGTDPTLSVVEALPTPIGDLLANRVTAEAGNTDLQLADRQTIDDLADGLRSRLRDTARNT